MNDTAKKLSHCARCRIPREERICLVENGRGPDFCPTRRFSEWIDRVQEEYQKPMLMVNHFNIYEAQAVADANEMGIRIYNRLEDVSRILSRIHLYWKRRNEI